MGERTCFIQLPRYFIKLLTVTRLCLFPDKTACPEALASKIKMGPGSPSTTLDNYQLGLSLVRKTTLSQWLHETYGPYPSRTRKLFNKMFNVTEERIHQIGRKNKRARALSPEKGATVTEHVSDASDVPSNKKSAKRPRPSTVIPT